MEDEGRKQRRLLLLLLLSHNFFARPRLQLLRARVSLPLRLPGVESTDLPARCLRSRSQSVAACLPPASSPVLVHGPHTRPKHPYHSRLRTTLSHSTSSFESSNAC